VSSPVDAASSARYAVSSSEATLTFQARSTLHAVHGKATRLNGDIEAAWNPDGTLAEQPAPKMHVDFPVEGLSSGNSLQDREMWKMIDSKRFPRIAADLRDIRAAAAPRRYAARGDITFAGRSRMYDGEIALAHDGDRVTIDGELTVDIRDFGLKAPNLLIVKVDPIVSVRLHLVATKVA
jgi:polyisoprenoid-binding protein YceI